MFQSLPVVIYVLLHLFLACNCDLRLALHIIRSLTISMHIYSMQISLQTRMMVLVTPGP